MSKEMNTLTTKRFVIRKSLIGKNTIITFENKKKETITYNHDEVYEKNKERTEKSAVFLNLLASVADYLEVANECFDKHISILAMATRNQYELHLRITSLIQDETEMAKWESEGITDGIQAHEGFLYMSEKSTPETAIIQEEIDRLVRLRKKWGLPVVKNSMGAGNLAGKVGMKEEHDSFFKLYSKLVHPSSYLVNSKVYCSDAFFPILEINLQKNALSSITLDMLSN